MSQPNSRIIEGGLIRNDPSDEVIHQHDGRCFLEETLYSYVDPITAWKTFKTNLQVRNNADGSRETRRCEPWWQWPDLGFAQTAHCMTGHHWNCQLDVHIKIIVVTLVVSTQGPLPTVSLPCLKRRSTAPNPIPNSQSIIVHTAKKQKKKKKTDRKFKSNHNNTQNKTKSSQYGTADWIVVHAVVHQSGFSFADQLLQKQQATKEDKSRKEPKRKDKLKQ